MIPARFSSLPPSLPSFLFSTFLMELDYSVFIILNVSSSEETTSASSSRSCSRLCSTLKLPAGPETVEGKYQPYAHLKLRRNLLAMLVGL